MERMNTRQTWNSYTTELVVRKEEGAVSELQLSFISRDLQREREASMAWPGLAQPTLTRILPVPVWPEMSSPAQSLAPAMKSPVWPPSNLFSSSACFFCSAGVKSATFLQHTAAQALMRRTEKTPTMKERMEERRKHHHLRSARHSGSEWLESVRTLLTIIFYLQQTPG